MNSEYLNLDGSTWKIGSLNSMDTSWAHSRKPSTGDIANPCFTGDISSAKRLDLRGAHQTMEKRYSGIIPLPYDVDHVPLCLAEQIPDPLPVFFRRMILRAFARFFSLRRPGCDIQKRNSLFPVSWLQHVHVGWPKLDDFVHPQIRQS